jgi:hypothetical protein
MDCNAAVVIYEAERTELVHEKADTGARRADHLRKRLPADLRYHRFPLPLLAMIRQQ